MEPADDGQWYCHCCMAKNALGLAKCRVCGRDESYGQSGYPLPFHGDNAKVYRPGQLLDVMADIHATDSENWTALHVACANGNTSLVKELLRFKAQLDAVTNKGHTALHLAVHSGSMECVQQLLKSNVKGFGRIAQMLVQAGADVNATNIMLRTPLHCAAVVGRSDLALILLRAGAQLKALDAHGWDACQIAELFNHRELQELLIREGMTEKQAVIKELPPAPWHSDVWFEVVRMQTQRRTEHERAQGLLRGDEERARRVKEEAKTRVALERRTERQLQIRQQTSTKAAYDLSRLLL